MDELKKDHGRSTRPFFGHPSKCEDCGNLFVRPRNSTSFNCGCKPVDSSPIDTSKLPEETPINPYKPDHFSEKMEWIIYQRQWFNERQALKDKG